MSSISNAYYPNPSIPIHPILKGPMRLLAQQRGPDLVGDKRNTAPVLDLPSRHDCYLRRNLAIRIMLRIAFVTEPRGP